MHAQFCRDRTESNGTVADHDDVCWYFAQVPEVCYWLNYRTVGDFYPGGYAKNDGPSSASFWGRATSSHSKTGSGRCWAFTRAARSA